MHDALFAAQGNLDTNALVDRATELGLDVDRFVADLDDRRHSLRVARDVSSAADSGAAGTPTFFINGRRHAGGLTLDALRAALQTELNGLPTGARSPAR
jgi:predicted DsbA family dithiol-disulfide isomerase